MTNEVLAALAAGTQPSELRLLPTELPRLATLIPALVQATIHYSGWSMAKLKEELNTNSRFTDVKELLEQAQHNALRLGVHVGRGCDHTFTCGKKEMVRGLATTFARTEMSYAPGGEGFLEAQDEFLSHL